MLKIKDIVFDLCGNDFLEPYLRRELDAEPEAEGAPVLDDSEPAAGVRITSDATEGSFDEEFCRYTSQQKLPVAVLQCPNIVGTGMNGLPRRIAEAIYRGTMVHPAANDARISVVHAVDVARAAAIAAGTQGNFTLTDGVDPTVTDLTEAIAFRMADKRIITIPRRWAKLWLGSGFFQKLTGAHPVHCSFTDVFSDFKPVSVIDYLRTHVYDEQSL